VTSIPERHILEMLDFDRQELEVLDQFRPIISGLSEEDRGEIGRALCRKLWPDEDQYMQKLHLIIAGKNAGGGSDVGMVKQLRFNYAQQRFYKDVIVRCRSENRPVRGVVLKARQLGFSTFIQSWQYEQCDRERHHFAMTVSYDQASTEELFQKAFFIHSNVWFPRETSRKSLDTLEFAGHGSTFFARTAGNVSLGRGLTLHHVHCSEMPMWSGADEALTGLLQAVPVRNDTSILYESTAKGRTGEFYDAWNAAERGSSDFVPFFAPWFWDDNYRLDFATDDHARKFGRSLTPVEITLKDEHKLALEQLHWRRYKIRSEMSGSEARFRQEFPSNPSEAFLTTGSPVFDAEAIHQLERGSREPIWVGSITLEDV